MLKRIGNTIKKGLRKVGNFFKEIGRTFITPFRELTWPKRIFKLLMIGVVIFLAMWLALTVIVIMATAKLIFEVIFSFGGAIENGTNEAMGRNKRRRYYY